MTANDNIPSELLYTYGHAWIRTLKPGSVEIGITDHAQAQLGDIVSTDLPAPGTTVQSGMKSAVVESSKAASDVDSPVSGKIVTSNTALADNPALINDDPYGKGWLFRVAVGDEPSGLLSAADYESFLAKA